MPDAEIDIGDLNKRVVLQSCTLATTPTSAGQKIETWSDGAEYWAKVEPLSGRELWTARQLQATTTHRITMRSVGPIRPRDRLVITDPIFGARNLYVDAVFRVGELNEFLMVEASEPKDHT